MDEKQENFALTTIDNPFSPFTHMEEWYEFDMANGYNTCGLLDRVVVTSDDLSDADRNVAIRRAMDNIVKNDVFNRYIILRKKQ